MELIRAELIFVELIFWRNSQKITCRNVAIAKISSAFCFTILTILFLFFAFTHVLRFYSFYCLVDCHHILGAVATCINNYVQQSITRFLDLMFRETLSKGAKSQLSRLMKIYVFS